MAGIHGPYFTTLPEHLSPTAGFSGCGDSAVLFEFGVLLCVCSAVASEDLLLGDESRFEAVMLSSSEQFNFEDCGR